MRFLYAVAFSLCVSLCWPPAFAQQFGTVPAACAAAGGYELDNCLQKAFTQADGALNAAYRKAQAVIAANTDLSAEQKKAWQADLVAAQRAWLGFRDADCKFDLVGAEWNFGSGTTAAQHQCVLNLTLARTKELLERYWQS